jgi:hypothetical protein
VRNNITFEFYKENANPLERKILNALNSNYEVVVDGLDYTIVSVCSEMVEAGNESPYRSTWVRASGLTEKSSYKHKMKVELVESIK